MTSSAPDVHAVSNSVLDRLIADNVGDTPWADLVLAACNGTEARCSPDCTATALHHGLTVATRNSADFAKAGVRLVDPFTGM